MTFKEFQDQTRLTVQSYDSKDQQNYYLGYLGLAGEAGSVLTTLKKKLRDGDGFGHFRERLVEELGDVLWYISAIASHNNIELSDIAAANIIKTKDRFTEYDILKMPRLDALHDPAFPDSFVIEFAESTGANELLEVTMFLETDEGKKQLGDALTDNCRQPNNYRFHDVFHLGHVAYLGWSPVIRSLMELKRRGDYLTLDAEDRGRPQVAEEAITLIVYNYAKGNRMLQHGQRIDSELLNMVKQLVVDLEVSRISANHWEQAIIRSYEVFHQVLQNRGGRVLVSPSERKLEYLGKL